MNNDCKWDIRGFEYMRNEYRFEDYLIEINC